MQILPHFSIKVFTIYDLLYIIVSGRTKEEMGNMGKNEDLTGQRFGRLTVIGLNEEVSKQKEKNILELQM